jgi:hypothetical protein
MSKKIKSIFGNVLFEHEAENNTIKETLVKAVEDGADLSGADLSGANLRGANLRDANLRDANLRDANLRDATIYYEDWDFPVDNKIDRFIYKTNIDHVETEMYHDIKSCRRWSFTWKNVLKIKSWTLKDAVTEETAEPECNEKACEVELQPPEITDEKPCSDQSEPRKIVREITKFYVSGEPKFRVTNTIGTYDSFDEAEKIAKEEA